MGERKLSEKISRRDAISRIGCYAAGIAAMPLFARSAFATGEGQRPNLILIIADDLGYGDVSCFGSPDIVTPNLDAIASQGVRFSNFYVAAPICSPTRVSAMTGKYPHRTSLPDLPDSHLPDHGLSPDEVMLPEVLKTAGYATGLTGKWHLGYSPKFRPRRQGFDEVVSELAGSADFWDHSYETDGIKQKWVFRNDTPWDEPGYLTDIWTNAAKSFISRHQNQPFFLYLPYNAPHAPLSTADGRTGATRAIYKSVVESMDAGIGQVMQQVHDCGLDNNTLVVFFGDNGSDTAGVGNNGPLRGGKWTLYEGALRTPFVAKWPAQISPGRVVTEPIVSMDVFNTFATAAGAKIPPGAGVDGRNVLKVMQGTASSPHEYFFWRITSSYAVRRGRWKLVQQSGVNELYDLNADIGENNNLVNQQPTIVRELSAKITQWQDTLARRTSYAVTDD
jgi:arylsulfatase A